ncbi:MAG: hypothetical protein AB1627_01090 [Chloroflexota bacterium]
MSPTWEGLDLQPAHRRWRFWIEQGRDELPDARTSSDLIPFRRGRLHQPAAADRRVLEVRGYIQEASLSAFRAQHDTLKGLLDPEAETPGTLVDDFEDGSARWIRAVPRNLMSRHGGEATRLLSIELEALDPYWYSAWGSLALDAGYALDEGLTLDSSAEIIVVPTSTAHVIPIVIPGTADCERVSVRMTGPSVAAPGVDVPGSTPIGFLLGTPLAAGEVAELDNAARSVTVDGVTARASLDLLPGNRHGEYLRLPRGTTALRVLGQPAEARILFTPTYQ